MSHKIKKWKIIFLTVSVLCLAVLAGGIYVWKGEKVAKNSKKPSISEKTSPTNKEGSLSVVNRIKIKNAGSNRVEWKGEFQKENDDNSWNEMNVNKKYVLEMLQEAGFCDPNFKSFWENWEQELRDDAWLVKEKCQASNGVIYSSWYENDQGEKIKELRSRKWW